jgi:branched-chain amino acid transport system substrate-binding protein
VRGAAPTAAIAAVALTLLAGCGADQSRGGEVVGDTLTIYSSLPLQGPHAGQARAIINGEKLAIQEAGGKAGSFKVNFASRDDSTSGEADEPGWSPGRTADNASKAAQDSRTIGYVGEFDSGATAISLPITNEAGFVQIGPAPTAVGLTKLVPGADKGEPDKHYPSGDRSFARVVPADDVQAAAGASWAKLLGLRRVFVVDDKGVEGIGLAEQFRAAADRMGGLEIADQKGMDPRAGDYADFAREVEQKNPELVYFTGGVESNAVRFWKDMREVMPNVPMMGTGGLLVPDFYDALGSAADRTYITSPTKDLTRLPAEGQQFVREYRREFDEQPDPYAAYGHASMSLLLDAIRRAGDNAKRRGDVVDRVFETRDFRSVIGTFSIDENGDNTIDEISGYRLSSSGEPRLAKVLHGETH